MKHNLLKYTLIKTRKKLINIKEGKKLFFVEILNKTKSYLLF